ncbi:MAG: hypothetical protein Q7T93_15355 [Methylobacterium sp.]|uniref:hypothetical protein n=1 Tax=Methylobacterium sp. TaxID=409 RepID=UPI0027193182|nr:hypothetical protein [Methylobacterium sp.]MDO9428193.1 hypothetical protein [Methylobacterium sp.]
MVAYTLLVTVFLWGSSGTVTTSSMSATFQSKDACENARVAYVAEASSQGGWISGKPNVVALCAKAG